MAIQHYCMKLNPLASIEQFPPENLLENKTMFHIKE